MGAHLYWRNIVPGEELPCIYLSQLAVLLAQAAPSMRSGAEGWSLAVFGACGAVLTCSEQLYPDLLRLAGRAGSSAPGAGPATAVVTGGRCFLARPAEQRLTLGGCVYVRGVWWGGGV